jgi:hypothetical protein
MSYGKNDIFRQAERALHHTREVTGSSPVSPSVVSYAEIDTYDYLHMCSAAVTLLKKAVVLPVFEKGKRP